MFIMKSLILEAFDITVLVPEYNITIKCSFCLYYKSKMGLTLFHIGQSSDIH